MGKFIENSDVIIIIIIVVVVVVVVIVVVVVTDVHVVLEFKLSLISEN